MNNNYNEDHREGLNYGRKRRADKYSQQDSYGNYVVCPSCKTKNDPQNDRCFYCGSDLQTTQRKFAPLLQCPICGNFQSAYNKQCAFCNTIFSIQAPSDSSIQNKKIGRRFIAESQIPAAGSAQFDNRYNKKSEQYQNNVEKPSTVIKQERKKSGTGSVFVFIIFVIIFLVIIGKLSSNNSSSSSASYSTSSSGSTYKNLSKAEAWSIAIEHVKEQLKSPSSAKYSYSLNDYTIKNTGDTWIISGYIESTNSFGAYIRSHFETKFVVYRQNGKDMVKYVYANID